MQNDPGRSPEEASTRDPLVTALLQPLVDLRMRYAGIQAVVTGALQGLERIEQGVVVPPARATGAPSGGPRGRPPGAATAELHVRSRNIERVLDFQERLATVEGVGSISVVGSNEQATRLLVELVDIAPGDPEDEEPTVACAWCGRILREGGARVSHGLCPDCAYRVLADG